jgi:pyridoxal phosphate enzyme (YggS family)
LAAALAEVRERIGRACDDAGRSAADVRLIAVTKFFPASDAAILAELGVADLGESRDQEASAKAREVAGLTVAPVRWHFVGRLQSNKAASVAGYAHLVHSVDRAALVPALAAGVRRADRAPLLVLVQVSLDGDTTRGGVPVDDVEALADHVATTAELVPAGVMAVAPVALDPDQAFARLAEASERLRRHHSGAAIISAGMSNDLEAAVRHGATHLRIGTALLGARPPLVG